jgi:hypothetical protein
LAHLLNAHVVALLDRQAQFPLLYFGQQLAGAQSGFFVGGRGVAFQIDRGGS